MKKIISIVLLFFMLNIAAHAQSALDEVRFNINEYQIIGENPLGQKSYDALLPFIGEQYGLEGLSAAADALEQALIKAGYSFHRVNLPPQELLSGSVILEIVQFNIGTINVTGNQFYSEDNIKKSVPSLKQGSAPNTLEISQSVKFANINAAKSVVLRFNEGEEPNTIDAELKVTDKDPTSFFVALDNSGGHDTEAERLTLGYQNANIFDKDHTLTLTYTTAPADTDSASQFGINYQIPFYSNASRLNFLLSDSESNTGEVGDNNLVTGKGSVFAVNYSQAILTASDIEQTWSVGLSYKLFDNTQINTNTKVLSLPLELGYNFSYRASQSVLSGGLTIAQNIETGSNNSDTDYAATGRTNATSDWSAVRYHVSFDYLISGEWLLHAGLSGQSSSDSLISGEQFGVGGSGTLRGFEERSINGDEGQAVRIELWMPSLPYQVRWLVFADQASIDLKETNTLLNDGLDEDVSSVGLGFRWSWKQQLSVNLDYGKITKEGGSDTTINRKDDTKAHIGMVYRF